MSYMKKCLEIDPGLKCEAGFGPVGGHPEFYCVWKGLDIIGSGGTAASAWRDAWERLRGLK